MHTWNECPPVLRPHSVSCFLFGRPPLIVIRKIATRLFVSAAAGDLLQIFAKLGQRRCLDLAIQVHAACIRTGYLACRQLSLAFNLIFYSERRIQANEQLFLGEGYFT